MLNEEAPPNAVEDLVESSKRKYQYVMDKLSPQLALRWGIFAGTFFIYCLRVYVVNGWYIVTYALGIYLLNQMIGFLSPQFDPEENGDGTDLDLPTSDKEEFRPFARRLPEFKFWYACTRGTVTAFFLTFFQVFDVPVFWPILLLYFIVLFFITMKRQIRHMIKHRYVPWNFNKTKYTPGAAVAPKKSSE